jgi:hypothetical protein
MTKENFLGFRVKDIITLSDIQTQTEYSKLNVDFVITEVRIYKEPSEFFTYTGYLATYKPKPDQEHNIMLLVREIGDDFDLRVFYLDTDGPSDDFSPLFSPDADDLIDRFEASIHFGEEQIDVTWDRQGDTSFGIESTSTKTQGTDQKTLAEYFTNDETRGNPHCFIEWTGNKIGGYLEIWYGCEIRIEDVELLKINR